MRFDLLRNRRLGALLIAVLLVTGGCGQRGPLVLPGTPPTPTSPGGAEEDAQEDDESETDSER